jgi:hypothetical protein
LSLSLSQASKNAHLSLTVFCFFLYKIGEQEGRTGSVWDVEDEEKRCESPSSLMHAGMAWMK